MHYNIFVKLAFLVIQFNLLIRTANPKVLIKKLRISKSQDQSPELSIPTDSEIQTEFEILNEQNKPKSTSHFSRSSIIVNSKDSTEYILSTQDSSIPKQDNNSINKDWGKINENADNLCILNYGNRQSSQGGSSELSPDQSIESQNIKLFNVLKNKIQNLKLGLAKISKKRKDKRGLKQLEDTLNHFSTYIKEIEKCMKRVHLNKNILERTNTFSNNIYQRKLSLCLEKLKKQINFFFKPNPHFTKKITAKKDKKDDERACITHAILDYIENAMDTFENH